MLETVSDGETIPHRLLWQIVEDQAALANEREQDWSKPALVAMVFAFHTVEAYLNFVGERLASEIWRDERSYFKNEPYRGWNGKLRKVMELVDLPWPDTIERPLCTVIELKKLRDTIAHSKGEKLTSTNTHEDSALTFQVSQLRSMFTPKEKFTIAVCAADALQSRVIGDDNKTLAYDRVERFSTDALPYYLMWTRQDIVLIVSLLTSIAKYTRYIVIILTIIVIDIIFRTIH